mmetsp:Transcript_28345/g.47566  ORF Transcript_28345/g.47566 Transcript_28345/m.47566 type:complete len:429 (+) Transcript_28345:89-1375(+)
MAIRNLALCTPRLAAARSHGGLHLRRVNTQHLHTKSVRNICTQHLYATRKICTASTESTRNIVDTVTVTYRGKSFEVRKGAKLRTALLKNSVTPHNEGAVYVNCRGIGSCGTCAVEICGGTVRDDVSNKAPVLPLEWTQAERIRLNFPPHSSPQNQKLRLACQVRCNEDLTVIKRDRFWGQGDLVRENFSDTVSASSLQPLGSLEFIFDREPEAVERPEKPAIRQERANVLVQGLISALTETLRAIGVGGTPLLTEADSVDWPPASTMGELRKRLETDFTDRAYFITGSIDEGIYDDDCTFEDPTVKFSGLQLWKRNLRLLTPFLVNPSIELLGSRELDMADPQTTTNTLYAEGTRLLQCEWRLKCGLKLPWRPFVDLVGTTDYRVVTGDDGSLQISYHLERWNISGVEAIWQIIRPGPTEQPQNKSQ